MSFDDTVTESGNKTNTMEPVDFSKKLDYATVSGKTALITGGAGGIGFGLASELARNGARVAILDLDPQRGNARVDELRSQGLQLKFVQVDPASWESQSTAFKTVLAWSENQLDIVVPCAGLPMTDLTPYITVSQDVAVHGSEPRQPPIAVLMANLIGSYYTTSLALFYFNSLVSARNSPDWKPQLVLLSSIAGYEAISFGADYTAAKFAIRGLWKAIRKPKSGMSHYQANLIAPLSTRTGKAPEQALKNVGIKLNEVSDVVTGIMTCICDDSIEGRAIACPQGKVAEPGSNNFDLCDALSEYSGSKMMLQKIREGVFGNVAALM